MNIGWQVSSGFKTREFFSPFGGLLLAYYKAAIFICSIYFPDVNVIFVVLLLSSKICLWSTALHIFYILELRIMLQGTLKCLIVMLLSHFFIELIGYDHLQSQDISQNKSTFQSV